MAGTAVRRVSKRPLQMRNAKNMTVTRPQALRKALGNINTVEPMKSESSKVAKKDNLMKQKCEEYPEIETFIPYNPLDFEATDVPEEHKLSDRCLAGLPLFVSKDGAERFAALANCVLSPMEIEPIKYGKYLRSKHFNIKPLTPIFNSIDASIPLSEDIAIDFPLLCDF
ncbi:securin-like [Anomaloglossus baeobatrachus]